MEAKKKNPTYIQSMQMNKQTSKRNKPGAEKFTK